MRKPHLAVLALAGVLSLALAGCSSTSGDSAEGSGVALGASKDEYIAALEEMDEVELVAQAISAAGTSGSDAFDAYLDAVEEWSGGKITFERFYSGSIAPVTSAHEAVGDGRIDIAMLSPSYAPDVFPVYTTLVDGSGIGNQGPVGGPAQYLGWTNELATTNPEFAEEFEAADMHLLAATITGTPGSVHCAKPGMDSPSDYEGASVSAPTPARVKQVEALGATAVTLPFTDTYEGIQRGIIQCSATGPTAALTSGLLEVAPHMVVVPSGEDVAPDTGMALTPAALATNVDVWESLPIAAQQLLYDRLDALYLEMLDQQYTVQIADALRTIDERGGEISYLDDDAVEALSEANQEILAGVESMTQLSDGAAYVESMFDASQKWNDIAEESGLPVDTSWEDMLEWTESGTTDVDAFVEQLVTEALGAARPE
jgi:TRAP-type C4-dicarboxylate transport system substrate-binding protein